MKNRKILTKVLSVILISIMFLSLVQQTSAIGLIDELFNISFYSFHYVNENGDIRENTSYSWGSSDAKEQGIVISKTNLDTIHVSINATGNELYTKTKPVLMWVHMGDSIFDTTKILDKERWYENKLEETFLLTTIPDYTQNTEITIDVPMKLNIGAVGILNGGYYEIEFFQEGAIPQQLMFAYEAQTYSLEDLEKYINFKMSDSIAEYYNADSGFRPETDGFSFRNSDYVEKGGVCAGIASVTTAKYNGYQMVTEYKVDDTKYIASPEYTWYNNVYGNESIHEIVLQNNKFITENSPSLTGKNGENVKAYPLVLMSNSNENDAAFYNLLKHYLVENNKSVFLKGNAYVGDIKWTNLQNRWSIIDYVASYLRQGKAVTVNISAKGQGGHAIVGYKMEQIDDDTFRLYCYDNNYPDNMELAYLPEAENIAEENRKDLNEDGSYRYATWQPRETYIDFTKNTIIAQNNMFSQKEYEVFEFDSTHTSMPATSENGTIAFSLNKGDKVGVFNYGNDANEIISYRAFPVIESNNTVEIRTFAFYKSGEVEEVTNSVNTTVKMDYSFLGWYKIKDSKITLTKKGFSFADSSDRYIECYVTYDNHTDSHGELKVRIPVAK